MKKEHHPFWWILSILFFIFLAYSIAYDSGYYEANISRKSKITEEKLQEFEEDVKKGNDIDIKDYVESDYIDYSSAVSKAGSKLSSSIDNFLENGLNDFFNMLSKLFI